MAKLLLNTHGVPTDEVEQVRQLLIDNELAFNETSRGVLGFSVPGFWLTEPSQYQQGFELYYQYQQQRYQLSQAQLQELIEQGQQPTWQTQLQNNPLKWLLHVGLVVVVLGVFFWPVWFLFNR